MELQEFLLLLMGGGGAVSAAITYWIMERIPVQDSETRRYISLAIPVVLGCAGYGLSVAAGYIPAPESGQELIEALFRISSSIVISLIGSQAAHGYARLRTKQ